MVLALSSSKSKTHHVILPNLTRYLCKHTTLSLPTHHVKLSDQLQVRFLDVEEIRDFCCDGAVCTTSEGVFLRIPEHIAQAVEVAALNDEVVSFLRADVHSETACNAVLELLFYLQFVLIGQSVKLIWDKARTVAGRLHSLAYAEAELRSYNEEALHSASLLSVAEVGKQRHLDIMYGSLICAILCLARPRGLGRFLPASLRIVKLSLKRTKQAEILLASVSSRNANGCSWFHALLDRRLERDAIQSNTAAAADSKVCARLANLSKNGRQYEKKEIRKKEETFHLISSTLLSVV